MSANPNLEPSNDLQELLRLNAEYIRSVQASDVAAFRKFLAPEFTASLGDGSFVEREEFLRRTAAPVGIAGLQASDVEVRIIGDTAVVFGRTSFVKPDGSKGGGRYTDVYQKQNGRWLAISAHVTRG